MTPSLQFPIGPFAKPDEVNMESWVGFVEKIQSLPCLLDEVMEKVTADEFMKPIRPGAWTKAQVIHHLADSHINAYCRCKLALTEDHPSIRPYDQNLWADLEDGKAIDNLMESVSILKGLHARWSRVLNSVTADQLNRQWHHPESNETSTLFQMMAYYAWHGEHHLRQILPA